MTTGVVLMTYGAPRDAADVPAYLTRVRGGKTPTPELIAEMRRRYERIGGSPLIGITRAQATALEQELNCSPDGRWVVAAGMRFSAPTLAEAVRDIVERGAERIIGLCLSPQWSAGLMGGYTRGVDEAVEELDVVATHLVIGAWHREPAFLAALATFVSRALARLGEASASVPVVFTAHSLPHRIFEAEPEYIAQLRETALLVAERAGLSADRWEWAYQSAGHTAEEWLRPDLKELFPALAAAGHRDVLVAPVQFLADHLEVLYDLDVAAAEEARAAGLRYHRTAMPNTDPLFIGALAAIVRSVLPALG